MYLVDKFNHFETKNFIDVAKLKTGCLTLCGAHQSSTQSKWGPPNFHTIYARSTKFNSFYVRLTENQTNLHGATTTQNPLCATYQNSFQLPYVKPTKFNPIFIEPTKFYLINVGPNKIPPIYVISLNIHLIYLGSTKTQPNLLRTTKILVNLCPLRLTKISSNLHGTHQNFIQSTWNPPKFDPINAGSTNISHNLCGNQKKSNQSMWDLARFNIIYVRRTKIQPSLSEAYQNVTLTMWEHQIFT